MSGAAADPNPFPMNGPTYENSVPQLSDALQEVLNAAALRRRIRDEERVLATSPRWREAMLPKPRFLPL